ncbi:MAG: hypothetical protein CME25_11795 [Gemmatimonadetes bacterium]|nr:hypothetical protein [Gemmatimonadota bacterium]|tara:strand:- start:504 stop:758 length:255 start_codon:yes stop_codon:yes gene_type:complete
MDKTVVLGGSVRMCSEGLSAELPHSLIICEDGGVEGVIGSGVGTEHPSLSRFPELVTLWMIGRRSKQATSPRAVKTFSSVWVSL